MAEQERNVEAGAEPTTFNLLFVCSGNTCRSPLAEAIARAELEQRGWTHVVARSAGTGAVHGAPASENAMRVAAEHGLDLATHESQPVTAELIDWADLILGMGNTHVLAVAELGGAAKVGLATDFLEDDEIGMPIDDPFGGDIDAYRATYTQLARAVGALLARLEPILSP